MYKISDVVTVIPIIIAYIKEFIPKPKRPKIVKLVYLIIIDVSDTKNNLFVLFIDCIAAVSVGCIYNIKKKGPIIYI